VGKCEKYTRERKLVMIRKILSVILVVVMLVALGVPALALQSDGRPVASGQGVLSHQEIASMDDLISRALARDKNDARNRNELVEFAVVQELESRRQASIAMSAKELEMVTHYRALAAERVDNLSRLDEASLLDLGYDADEIYIIRNFRGTDEQFMALSATANVWLDIDWLRFDTVTRRTSTRLFFQFRWTREPLFGMSDYMALTWNNWMITGRAANVMYVDDFVNHPIWQSPTFVDGNHVGAGAAYRFRAKIDDNRLWAQEGFAIFVLDSAGERDIMARGELIHRQFGLSINPPSFSLPGGAALSITIGFTATRFGVDNSMSLAP